MMQSMSSNAASKSKRIKDARKALSKALKEHAEIAAGSGVSLKKAQRAGAKVAAAAAAYSEAVLAKTGLESPFVPGSGKLDGDTIRSLQAERVAIEHVVTGALPVVEEPAP
jgi:cell division septum initiation protein DivIVA